MSLRRRLAEFGFESNDDYDYALRCLWSAPPGPLRCLNVTGESGRRKTAFANALGHALEFARILYFDFSQRDARQPPPQVADEHGERSEPALSPFERAVVEACAFSESERTLLILDQLQLGDFQDHIRLYHFVQSREWRTQQGCVVGNPRNLLLVLISEQPLYHSLQRVSFRVWTDPDSQRFDYVPEDFGLGQDSRPVFDALATLFAQLGQVPTPSEMAKLLADLQQRIRTTEHLRQSLFGWVEHIDRTRLYAAATEPALQAVVEATNRYVGLDEIQLGD